ncbi:hypothetical protein [Streptacidiphilus sp. EB103A]|uniref:hypothetical protein n=1 Tax=Streptacidiphilus sp. EB103A TaxID=3156275 RepID=UPI003516D6A3
MKDPDDVRAAFAALPARVTLEQVAEATGRTLKSVQTNWASAEDFPPGDRGPARRQRHDRDTDRGLRRDRDAVLAWYLRQPLAGPARPGGNRAADRARALPAPDVEMSTGQIAETLGLTPAAVASYYVGVYGPDSRAPFPPADPRGLRRWPAVRDWFLRENPDPIRPTPLPEDTDAAQLAEQLGIRRTTALAILRHHTGTRLRRPALARAVGLGTEQVKNYIRNHGPDSTDPFPPADEDRAHDVEQVLDWLARHGRKHPERVVTDLAALPELITNDQIQTAAAISAGTLRAWTKLPGFPPLHRQGTSRLRDRDALITWYQNQHEQTDTDTGGDTEQGDDSTQA